MFSTHIDCFATVQLNYTMTIGSFQLKKTVLFSIHAKKIDKKNLKVIGKRFGRGAFFQVNSIVHKYIAQKTSFIFSLNEPITP